MIDVDQLFGDILAYSLKHGQATLGMNEYRIMRAVRDDMVAEGWKLTNRKIRNELEVKFNFYKSGREEFNRRIDKLIAELAVKGYKTKKKCHI